jgi:hypothetical protein
MQHIRLPYGGTSVSERVCRVFEFEHPTADVRALALDESVDVDAVDGPPAVASEGAAQGHESPRVPEARVRQPAQPRRDLVVSGIGNKRSCKTLHPHQSPLADSGMVQAAIGGLVTSRLTLVAQPYAGARRSTRITGVRNEG